MTAASPRRSSGATPAYYLGRPASFWRRAMDRHADAAQTSGAAESGRAATPGAR
jgi:hypothetical protein